MRRWWFICAWPVLLLVAVSVQRCAATRDRDDGLLQGLPGTIARALNRIRGSRRDYRLVDDLWLEALPETAGDDTNRSAAAFKSPLSRVADLADSVFDTHRLSWHNSPVPGLDVNVYKDRTRQYVFDMTRQNENSHHSVTRTFGFQRRRLQLIMLPVMYKLGVITTLLTGLTVLSLKGVTIGVILLMLAVTSVVAKLSKHHQYAAGPYAAGPFAVSPWAGPDPFDRSSAPHQLQPPLEKNIHVHVHTAPGGGAPAALSSSAVLRNRPGPAAAADDGNINGPYWNRGGANDEYYYDAAMDYHNNNNNNNNRYRFGNIDDDGSESTTSSSAYHRWLG